MKREEKTAITKEKIVKVALEEFGEHGYASTTLNTICKRSVSKGLFYHNFESKDALYLECLKRCFDDLVLCIEKQNIQYDTQKYLSARLKFLEENKHYRQLFYEGLIDPPSHLNYEIDLIKEEFDKLNNFIYLNILDSIKLRNGVTKEKARIYFNMLQTMFNGYFSSPNLDNISVDERIRLHEDYLSTLIDFTLYGIAERGE